MPQNNSAGENLPDGLRTWLQRTSGGGAKEAVLLRGGMINTAARIKREDGTTVFAKWYANAPPRFYQAEAEGLRELRNANVLRVPNVLAVQDRDAENPTAFLVLEYIPHALPTDTARFAQRFGTELARLHRQTSLASHAYGLEADNYIGNLPQINGWRDDWTDFYHECRLLPQIEIARRNGHLPPYREQLLADVLARLDTYLAGLHEPSCLLHGDLWSGNFLCAQNAPVLIDPAAYYGPREMELAYIELFGGFPPGFMEAYRAAFPLDVGYTRRRPLHQLYPLLNHLNHFGETYGPQLDYACRILLTSTMH